MSGSHNGAAGTSGYRYEALDSISFDRAQLEYELSIQQQPKQARMCGVGTKAERRPIDPPPVVRLRIRDRSRPPGQDEPQHLIQSPFYFMFSTLLPPEGDEELFTLAGTKTRYLMGTTVSSLYHLRDPQIQGYAAYFVFADVGIRVEGTYRFKLTMYEIANSQVVACASIVTEPFTVYSAKNFPGMLASSELTTSLAEQGTRTVRVRKTARQRRRTDNDDDDDGSDPPLPKAKRLKSSSAKYDSPMSSPASGTHSPQQYTGAFQQQQQQGYGGPMTNAYAAAAMANSQSGQQAHYGLHVPVPSYMPPTNGQANTYAHLAQSQRGAQQYPYGFPPSDSQNAQFGYPLNGRNYAAYGQPQAGFNAGYGAGSMMAYGQAGYPMVQQPSFGAYPVPHAAPQAPYYGTAPQSYANGMQAQSSQSDYPDMPPPPSKENHENSPTLAPIKAAEEEQEMQADEEGQQEGQQGERTGEEGTDVQRSHSLQALLN